MFVRASNCQTGVETDRRCDPDFRNRSGKSFGPCGLARPALQLLRRPWWLDWRDEKGEGEGEVYGGSKKRTRD